MRHHGQDALIQTKATAERCCRDPKKRVCHVKTLQGVRALGSGVQWPQDVQERARYSHRRAAFLAVVGRLNVCQCRRAVELTKTAWP